MTSKKQQVPKLKTTLKKAQKDTIYVDVDDDITALINSVKKSESPIVAIVLPKNAHVLQSIVNMKLLKRSATRVKKNIALITSDNSIQTLAGIAGVHVAETANSKPFIPTVSIEDVDDVSESDSVVDMGDGEVKDEAVELDEDSEATDTTDDTTSSKQVATAKATSATSASAKIKMKNKKFKIPDFGSFQVKLFLGCTLVVILLVLWYIGFVVMPKATVAVQTNTQSVPLKDSVTLIYDDSAEVDVEEKTVPAKKVSTEKSSEATEQATGEKNVGEKAKGSVTMSAQVCGAISSPSSVPKGTGVSTNGKTYITQEDASFSFSSFDGSCLNFQGDTVGIIAQDSGEEYDTTKDTSFTVSGRSDVEAVGDASGGTTKLVTIVSDKDVENAKKSLGDAARGEALQELKQKLTESGFSAMDITLKINEPVLSISPKVGEEATTVTVSQKVTYELSGYRSDDLKAIVDAVLADTLSAENESKNVSDNGFDTISFESSTNNTYQFSTVATIGPSLDIESLKEEFAGKKRGEIVDRLESIDGVVKAEVTYTPMWITTTPKSAKKINIEVQTQ